MKKHVQQTAAIVATATALAIVAWGQEDAEEEAAEGRIFYELQTIDEDSVGYRKMIKQALESHMAAYGLILTARSSHADHAEAHADAIAELGRQHKVIYPAGSETDSTRPEIWSQPEAFEERLEHLAAAAAFLKEKDDEGNRHLMLNALIKLGESCEGCHQRYRIDND